MKFTNAYANSANCVPSRAALLSGQYYPNNPIYTVESGARRKAKYREMIPPENRSTLPLSKLTVTERLQKAGYATGFIGKWHLGDPPEADPKQQGFEVNVGRYSTGRPSWSRAYLQPGNNPYIDGAERSTYLTDHLSERALDSIEGHRDSSTADRTLSR